LIQKEKVKQAVGILNEENVDMWVVYGRETPLNSDPVIPLLYPGEFVGETLVVICKSGGTYIIGDHFDANAYRSKGIYGEALMYPNGEDYTGPFYEILKKEQPKTIALDYSEESITADGLGYGQYLNLLDVLEKGGYTGEVISAERIIMKLRGRKTEEEIDNLRQAAKIAEQIFQDARGFIHAGTTEKQIYDFFHERMKFYGVEPGWAPDSCPGVQVGPNTIVGHIAPGDLAAQPGDLITMDFGVKVNGYSSDVQRVFYVLKDDEDKVPDDVQQTFERVQHAVRVAVSMMKPGTPAYVPDEVCKAIIKDMGMVPNQASFGHQIGVYVHDGGITMGGRGRKLCQEPLEEGLVLTIDQGNRGPRGKMGQEDDGVVRADGVEWLTTQQTEVYTVR